MPRKKERSIPIVSCLVIRMTPSGHRRIHEVTTIQRVLTRISRWMQKRARTIVTSFRPCHILVCTRIWMKRRTSKRAIVISDDLNVDGLEKM